MATYTVKAGDSLSMIAEHVLGHTSLWPALASINHIGSPFRIYPGQVLQLPRRTVKLVRAPKGMTDALPVAKPSRFGHHRVYAAIGLLSVGAVGVMYYLFGNKG